MFIDLLIDQIIKRKFQYSNKMGGKQNENQLLMAYPPANWGHKL